MSIISHNLTIEEATREYHVTRATIYKWIKDPERLRRAGISAFKVGAKWLICPAEKMGENAKLDAELARLRKEKEKLDLQKEISAVKAEIRRMNPKAKSGADGALATSAEFELQEREDAVEGREEAILKREQDAAPDPEPEPEPERIIINANTPRPKSPGKIIHGRRPNLDY